MKRACSENSYSAPSVKVLNVIVENGFAGSVVEKLNSMGIESFGVNEESDW